MSIIAALALAATTPQVAVVGTHGPELRDVVPPAPKEAPTVAPEEPKCLKRARVFNYTAAALDIATTIAAIDRGAVEGNPVVAAILGKKPGAAELIAFKAVPIIGMRLLDRHLIHKGEGTKACYANAAMGLPTLIVAGLNMRFVF